MSWFPFPWWFWSVLLLVAFCGLTAWGVAKMNARRRSLTHHLEKEGLVALDARSPGGAWQWAGPWQKGHLTIHLEAMGNHLDARWAVSTSSPASWMLLDERVLRWARPLWRSLASLGNQALPNIPSWSTALDWPEPALALLESGHFVESRIPGYALITDGAPPDRQALAALKPLVLENRAAWCVGSLGALHWVRHQSPVSSLRWEVLRSMLSALQKDTGP